MRNYLFLWCVLNLKCLPTGQAWLLHTWDIVPSPTQSFPPYLGTGSEQRRLRVWIPPAQVTVQVSHGDQGPQPPSTKTYHKNNIQYVTLNPYHNIHCYWNSTHWDKVTFGRFRFDVLLPGSPCHPSGVWGSCRGVSGWWPPHHRSQSMKTRETSGSNHHPVWLWATDTQLINHALKHSLPQWLR